MPSRRRLSAAAAAAFAAVTLAAAAGPAPAAETGADWPAYNGPPTAERYSALAEITTANVAGLREVCSFDTGEAAAFQAGPVVVGGVMYVTTDQSTFALDAATCAERWRYRYAYFPGVHLKVNRGVALAGGRVFRGTGDGRVVALDAGIGERLWATDVGDHFRGETVPAAPVVWRDTVVIGNAGGDYFGVRGKIFGLDAATGAVRWRFDMVPSGEEVAPSERERQASSTWPAPTPGRPRSGGATWSSYTVDPEAGLVYVPGGNPAPDFVPALRPGENLYANSVVVLDARTGGYRGHHPIVLNDFHDWDVAAAPVLLTTASGRRLLAVAPKDGHLYGIEPASGRRLYRVPVTTIENADAPLTPEGTRFCPGTQGGTEWNGPAYHPGTNLLYVGAVDWCSTVRTEPPYRADGYKGLPWTGEERLLAPFGTFDPPERWQGWLTAVDADTGEVRWRYRSPAPFLSGVTATAGGLVLAADLHGEMIAFDARVGSVLWRTALGQAVGGGLVTYAAGGRQLVALASGMSQIIWPVAGGRSRVVVFGLR